jgi:hypothetical protein
VPLAAAVAAATCGLAGDWQSPKGGTLLAAVSVMTPTGVVAETCAPDAAKVDGAAPIEHCSVAPVTTWLPTCDSGGRRVLQESFYRDANGLQDTLDRGRGTGRACDRSVDGGGEAGSHCDFVDTRLFPPQTHDDHPIVGDGIISHTHSF